MLFEMSHISNSIEAEISLHSRKVEILVHGIYKYLLRIKNFKN